MKYYNIALNVKINMFALNVLESSSLMKAINVNAIQIALNAMNKENAFKKIAVTNNIFQTKH